MANYIKKLEAENVALLAEVKAKNDLLADLRVYLASSKFHNDPTVQVRDIDAKIIAIMLACGEE